MNALIIIPARMASSRLPGKPLADIHGVPMIVHVLRRARESQMGPVFVACAEIEILETVKRAGGDAVLTDPDLPSGTDRVLAAARQIDPKAIYDVIVNVQGDMPAMEPEIISDVLTILANYPDCDIATAAVMSSDKREIEDPNVVKAILSESGQALYFTRAAAPSGNGPIWHHVGIYAYRRKALEQFCALAPSYLEKRERLEQLRALEAGMKIYAAILDTAPDGVDTPDDLARAKTQIGRQFDTQLRAKTGDNEGSKL